MNTKMKKALAGLACGLAIAAGAASASAANGVLKTPYLLYPNVPTQMEVLWQDNNTETDNLTLYSDSAYSQVVCSDTSAEYSVTGTAAYGHQHAYIFGNTTACGPLTPDTMYYYSVTDSTSTTYQGFFMTAPYATDTHVRFIAQGDSRSQPFALDELDQAVMQFTSLPGNSEYARFSVVNGDWVSTDGDSYWASQWFLPTQTNLRKYTAITPLNGAKGNHDDSGGYSASLPKYYPYPNPNLVMLTTSNSSTYGLSSSKCKTSASTPAGANVCVDSDGNPYYANLFWSFDYGPVHFTVIDEYSSMAAGSVQYNWVQSDLANTTKPWKIVIYHEPGYGTGSDGDNTAVRIFEPFFAEYNVDAIFCGHNHNYVRAEAYNLNQAGGDNIALGVPHITAGGGGAPIYQPVMGNTGSFPHVITAWPTYVFMAFDVTGDTLTMTSYQANNITDTNATNPPTPNPPTNISYTMMEQTVLHHYPEVTSQIAANVSGISYNRSTKTYSGTVTLTNNGPALSGDLHLWLDGIINLQGINTNVNSANPVTNPAILSKMYVSNGQTGLISANAANGPSSPASSALLTTVTVANQTGSHNGEPLINAGLSGAGLASGASVSIPVKFTNSSTTSIITFNPRVLNQQPGMN